MTILYTPFFFSFQGFEMLKLCSLSIVFFFFLIQFNSNTVPYIAQIIFHAELILKCANEVFQISCIH